MTGKVRVNLARFNYLRACAARVDSSAAYSSALQRGGRVGEQDVGEICSAEEKEVWITLEGG